MEKVDNNARRFASFFDSPELKEVSEKLLEALSKGSICIPVDLDSSEIFKDDYQITTDLDQPQPFVLDVDKLYIFRYYQYQEKILLKIRELVGRNQERLKERIPNLRDNEGLRHILETLDSNRPVDWQSVAAVMAFLFDFAIITGGPGTGKTTSVAKVLTLILSENEEAVIKMAAPTGKAANRMEQALKGNPNIPQNLLKKIQTLKATTIHRLLGSIHLSPYFKHHAENPIPADVVIIDESSMVDVALFAKLLDAIGPNTRLILLGDQNQLASVEAGSLFGDICSSVANQNAYCSDFVHFLKEFIPEEQAERIPTSSTGSLLQSNLTSLLFSYRFKEDKKIGLISKQVIQGNWGGVKDLLLDESSTEQLVYDQEYRVELFTEFVSRYETYIQETNIQLALRCLENIRVLAAVRMGKKGIYELNKQIEKILIKKGLIKASSEFYENRPLIVTKNYHELNLFNGDIGIIRDNKAWFLDERGEPKSFAPGLIAEVETVFAMTIHKSQGSEFDQVLMILPDQQEIQILTRELVYTGITRAKSKLVIQATLETLEASVQKTVNRASGLKEKL